MRTPITVEIEIAAQYVIDEVFDGADEETRLRIRFKSNCEIFRARQPRPKGKRGRKTKHGEKIRLNREETLRAPDLSIRVNVNDADGGWTMTSIWGSVHIQL